MSKSTKTADWWVRRSGVALIRGEKKDLGPFTHREARARAFDLYGQGWTVVLERRGAKGDVLKAVEPQFPRVVRGSRPVPPVRGPTKAPVETLAEAVAE